MPLGLEEHELVSAILLEMVEVEEMEEVESPLLLTLLLPVLFLVLLLVRLRKPGPP